MNNLMSYFGLVAARISASDIEFPVPDLEKSKCNNGHGLVTDLSLWSSLLL